MTEGYMGKTLNSFSKAGDQMRISQEAITTAIVSLERQCSENNEWYGGYMRSNAPRIVADAEFVLRHISPGSRILEVGAVPPLFTELLRVNGFSHCDIADPHPEPFNQYFSDMGINAYAINLLNGEGLELAGQYDLVCMNEVVEHLAGNLLVSIESAIKCIRGQGYLMVTTPNLRSFWGLTSLLVESSGLASKPRSTVRAQYERATSKYGYYGHIREYTKREIVELVSSFGMELRAVDFQSNYLDFGPLTRPIGYMERLFPTWRLFGKYLFQKKV